MADANDLNDLPARMRALPLDSVGRPIPAFAAFIDGKHDFRIIEPDHLVRCVRHGLCWVCGKPLGSRRGTFVVGPMCVVNRNSAEPPGHYDCSHWSATHCPFLVNPNKDRREGGLDKFTVVRPAGEMLRRNPGVTVLYTSRDWHPHYHAGGLLFDLGEPESLTWIAEGREATREEVIRAIDSGVPALREMCTTDREHRALDEYVERALALVP